MNTETAIELFTAFLLLAGGLVLTALAAMIIYGLYHSEQRGRMVNFLLEGSSKDGKPGKPSISRLQMLIWNFVVAFAFLYVLGNLTLSGAEAGTALKSAMEALLNPQVLTLLGISNGTYVIGKLTSQGGTKPSETASQETKPASTAISGVPLSPHTQGTQGPVG